ncbi:hypothetical protein [Pasteurella canis]|uniref:hypothetical protein n=1 Tax=Pasteurella canis TaxID=753 RepID=UPI000D945427|nr:hypothetical protein [Pasteurella canis]SPY32596.1 Uncharacterised protein [Pasteurella canis]
MYSIKIKNVIKLFLLKFLRNKYQYKINIKNNIISIERKCDEFDLNQLKYVYLVKDPGIRNNRLTLYLNDFFKIGVNYTGFIAFYQKLSAQSGFDDSLFFEYLYKEDLSLSRFGGKNKYRIMTFWMKNITTIHKVLKFNHPKKIYSLGYYL